MLSHSPIIVTDGLVLCLDAANVRSYPKSGTVWSDLSGNGNNGTLTNGPTFSNDNAGSIVFDGSNDSVLLGSATDLGINNPSSGFSISVFFRTSNATEKYLVDNWGGGGQDISLRIDNYQLEYYLRTSTGNQYWNGTSRWGSFSSNAWTQFVLTFESGQYIRGYINGKNVGNSNIGSPTGTFETNSPFYIGRRPVSTGYFGGNISQVSIYNRALSQNEIKNNYLATKGRFGL